MTAAPNDGPLTLVRLVERVDLGNHRQHESDWDLADQCVDAVPVLLAALRALAVEWEVRHAELSKRAGHYELYAEGWRIAANELRTLIEQTDLSKPQ